MAAPPPPAPGREDESAARRTSLAGERTLLALIGYGTRRIRRSTANSASRRGTSGR